MKINRIIPTIIAALFITGCTAQSPPSAERLSNGAIIINNGREKIFTNVDEILNHAQQRDYNHECAETRAETIANGINNIDGVKKAAVVVSGSYAIVGITLERKINDGELIQLKYHIDKTVKQIDSNITLTRVSTAPDMFERTLDLSNGNDEKEKECLQSQAENDTLFRLIPCV